jgi:hypothetical protein
VCIDQGNLQEREEQVALMGEIYRGTQGNLIYLGEPSIALSGGLLEVDWVVTDMLEETNNLTNVEGTPFDAAPTSLGTALTGFRQFRSSREVLLTILVWSRLGISRSSSCA